MRTNFLTALVFAFISTANAQMVVDTFYFTGTQQIFVVPTPVLGIDSIQVDVRGAQGESGTDVNTSVGGYGGRVHHTMNINPGETFYVYVGGTNGFNGGGNASNVAGKGGGASDIRQGGTSLNNRIVVAGGGGGAGGSNVSGSIGGGGGGGFIGNDGSTCFSGGGGKGGNQTNGGNGGIGNVNGGSGSLGLGGAGANPGS